VSPCFVVDSVSGWKMPFSKVVSEGMGENMDRSAISSSNGEDGTIEFPFLLIWSIVGGSSVLIEFHNSHKSIFIVKFPWAAEENFFWNCVMLCVPVHTFVPVFRVLFVVNSEGESKGKKQRYDQDLIHLYYKVIKLFWHLKWHVTFWVLASWLFFRQ